MGFRNSGGLGTPLFAAATVELWVFIYEWEGGSAFAGGTFAWRMESSGKPEMFNPRRVHAAHAPV